MAERDQVQQAAPRRAVPSLFWVMLVAAVAALNMVSRSVFSWREMVGHRPSWEATDLDTALIHHGLAAAPGFLDTFRWWVGPWAGTVPFYRPLASYLFWVEWRLFGDREWLYGFPTGAAHVAATVLFAVLAYRLAQRWKVSWPAVVGLLAGCGFTGVGIFYREAVVDHVLRYWKNQPDSWAAICCFAALLVYLQARERGTAIPWAAALWYLAACCFKEAAVPLPLAALMLEFGAAKEELLRQLAAGASAA